MAEKGIAPRSAAQRGNTTAESVPAEERGELTTPEPPAETLWGVDRDGYAPVTALTSGIRSGCKQGGTVE